jgi:8-oxo-dGTP pyrophosphatase MutT (NUDIX family)
VTFDAALKRLEEALAGPRPGASAHALMAPRPRANWPVGSAPANARRAAALLLLFPHDRAAHLLLTVRAHTLDRHGGQVSLPGGVIEPGESVEEAALREAEEEVGLPPSGVRTLGRLTAIEIPVSGFRLQPVVAAGDLPPVLFPAAGEVARILHVPVTELLDTRCNVWRSRERPEGLVEFPAFAVQGVEIWGATAMVLAELLVLLGWKGPV